ncbi:MAG: hypothetical protein SFT81_00830 [Candidatus Caenarcaniphilales bacterium]|nr:hypothetical protein [Candidatus Caenarcaniphilales bacterium]
MEVFFNETTSTEILAPLEGAGIHQTNPFVLQVECEDGGGLHVYDLWSSVKSISLARPDSDNSDSQANLFVKIKPNSAGLNQ